MSLLVTFIPEPGHEPADGTDWPAKVIGDGFIHLELTWNREPLDSGKATYVDQFGERVVLDRLHSGRIVGEIRED